MTVAFRSLYTNSQSSKPAEGDHSILSIVYIVEDAQRGLWEHPRFQRWIATKPEYMAEKSPHEIRLAPPNSDIEHLSGMTL